jgi:hypothetical protein
LLFLALLAIGVVGIAAGVMWWLRNPDEQRVLVPKFRRQGGADSVTPDHAEPFSAFAGTERCALPSVRGAV